MPIARSLAALAAAASLAACAAGGHNVPDEAAETSRAPGDPLPGSLPFAGSVYPVPPSHHYPVHEHVDGLDGDVEEDAVAEPLAPAEGTTDLSADAIRPATGPANAPAAPAAPALTPAAPPADEPDEHADHAP